MKRTLKMALMVLVFYILQTSVFTTLRVSMIQPDLMAVMLACLTVYTGYYGGFCAGAMAGILMDTFVGHVMALQIVLYTLMGIGGVQIRVILENIREHFFKDRFRKHAHWVETVIVCLIIVIVREGTFLMYMFLNGVDVTYIHFLRIATCAVYSAVLTIPGDWMVRRLLYGKPKAEDDERVQG